MLTTRPQRHVRVVSNIQKRESGFGVGGEMKREETVVVGDGVEEKEWMEEKKQRQRRRRWRAVTRWKKRTTKSAHGQPVRPSVIGRSRSGSSAWE